MTQNQKNNRPEPGSRDSLDNRLERHSSAPNDLPDSEEDREKLKTEETYIELPDVKDIPGQEFVNAAPLGSLADTTISSDDEEGRNVFDREDSEDLRTTGDEGDVSRGQRIALQQTDYLPTRDEDRLAEARMDNVDFQNTPLNEKGFGARERTGEDLDVPGDTDRPASGPVDQDDEENSYYSQGGDDNSSLEEDRG